MEGKDEFKEYLRSWIKDKEKVKYVLESKKKIWFEIKDNPKYTDAYKEIIKDDIEWLEKRLRELEGK